MAGLVARRHRNCSIGNADRNRLLAGGAKTGNHPSQLISQWDPHRMKTQLCRQVFERTRRRSFPLRAAGLTGAALRLTLAGAVLAVTASGAMASMLPCSAPEAITRLHAPTPALTKAFAANEAIRIVAFGSSSTEGAGASAQERTYPARLATMLRRMLPGRTFTVINRGRGGQLARDMLARLERDVISAEPTLVIWQTGVNDAIRGVDMGEFQAVVDAGIVRLKADGIDVILLDAQYYPRALKVKDYRAYQALLRKIGAVHKVPVFRRYQLMTHLVESGQFRIEELLAADRFHLNDTSYDCLGSVIAEAIRVRADAAIGPVRVPQAGAFEE
jgi:acyl-CoA thioesterase-1